MKKIIILLPVLLAFVASAIASPVLPDNKRVMNAFKQQFEGAENVTWSEVQGRYEKATFVWAGHVTTAYFNKLGEFVGAIRTLYNSQVPLAVSRTLNSSYKGYELEVVRELTSQEGTSYSLVVKWKNKRYRVRLLPDGSILESDKV